MMVSTLLATLWLMAMMLMPSTISALAQEGVSVEGESAEQFRARLQERFEPIFQAQQDEEVRAMWVAIYDPLFDQGMFFALGNSSGGTPPTLPATLDDHFDYGSITKTFAATIVMLLAEETTADEGTPLLSLDDTVADLVPDFAATFPLYANYTVEELMRMETLVPDFEEDTPVLLEGDPSRRFSDIYDIVNASMQRYPAPLGTYSSTNFLVIELIVDTISTKSLRELVQEKILTPLGMENTVFPELDSDGIRPSPAAIPYAGNTCAESVRNKYGFPGIEPGDNIEEISRAVVFAGASGSMVGTIKDLLIWAKSGVGDDLLSEMAVSSRHQYNRTVGPGGSISYGIGQFVYSPQLINSQPLLDYLNGWYGHTGGTFGFTSSAYVNQDLKGAAFASGMNTCDGSVDLTFLQIYTDDLKARISKMINETQSTNGDATSPPPSSTDSNANPPATATAAPTSDDSSGHETSSSDHMHLLSSMFTTLACSMTGMLIFSFVF